MSLLCSEALTPSFNLAGETNIKQRVRWSTAEIEAFFDSLASCSCNADETFGGMLDLITMKVKTKTKEQIRYYYYRALRKVNSLFAPYKIKIVEKEEAILALECLWHLQKTTAEPTPQSLHILFHQKKKETPVIPTKRVSQKSGQKDEKIRVQLIPKQKEQGEEVSRNGHNPKLQLTLRATKTMSFIVDHITKKWNKSGTKSTKSIPASLRLHHPTTPENWGVNDQVPLNEPFPACNLIKLLYSWDPDDSNYDNDLIDDDDDDDIFITSPSRSDPAKLFTLSQSQPTSDLPPSTNSLQGLEELLTNNTWVAKLCGERLKGLLNENSQDSLPPNSNSLLGLEDFLSSPSSQRRRDDDRELKKDISPELIITSAEESPSSQPQSQSSQSQSISTILSVSLKPEAKKDTLMVTGKRKHEDDSQFAFLPSPLKLDFAHGTSLSLLSPSVSLLSPPATLLSPLFLSPGEKSSLHPLLEEGSRDGLATPSNTDEKECHRFYGHFEVSFIIDDHHLLLMT